MILASRESCDRKEELTDEMGGEQRAIMKGLQCYAMEFD